MTFTT